MAKNKALIIDIPNAVLQAFFKEEIKFPTKLRDILEKALPKYFDSFGVFRGLEVGFSIPLLINRGRDRVNAQRRMTIYIEEATWLQLDRIRMYTTINIKNIAEIVILKELLQGGTDNAKAGALYYEQSAQADDRPFHQGKGAGACDA